MYQKYRFDGVNVDLPPLVVHRDYLSPLEGFNSTTFTKPISNILVKCLPDGSYRFLACTAAGSEFCRKEFQHLKESGSGDVGKYALIGFDNHTLYSSSNLTLEEKKTLEGSPAVHQMTTYTAFLNGQIKDPYVLRDIVKKYEWSKDTFQKLIEGITKRHASHHPIKLTNHSFFEMLCGWRKVDANNAAVIDQSAEAELPQAKMVVLQIQKIAPKALFQSPKVVKPELEQKMVKRRWYQIFIDQMDKIFTAVKRRFGGH